MGGMGANFTGAGAFATYGCTANSDYDSIEGCAGGVCACSTDAAAAARGRRGRKAADSSTSALSTNATASLPECIASCVEALSDEATCGDIGACNMTACDDVNRLQIEKFVSDGCPAAGISPTNATTMPPKTCADIDGSGGGTAFDCASASLLMHAAYEQVACTDQATGCTAFECCRTSTRAEAALAAQGVCVKPSGERVSLRKQLDEISRDENIADYVLHFASPEDPNVELLFDMYQYYATGTYTRNITAFFDYFNPEMTGGFPMCTKRYQKANGEWTSNAPCVLDLTGFDSPPDSLPAAPAERTKMGTTSTPPRERLGMAGAPVLDVTEVKAMKITIRPGGCSGRPAEPAAVDPSGREGVAWPDAPKDPETGESLCPWWYLATHPQTCDGGTRLLWAKHDDVSHRDDMCADAEGTPTFDDLILCESGACFLIDFHIELGGTAEVSRTVFGNPKNAVERGWETGSFFMCVAVLHSCTVLWPRGLWFQTRCIVTR